MGNHNISSSLIAAPKCPIHNNTSIEFVCIYARCIQPLCQHCIAKHQNHHTSIGTPPVLRSYKELVGSLTQTINLQADMYTKNTEFSQSVRRLSTVDTIKQMTRQYFLKKRSAFSKNKQANVSDLMQCLEMCVKMNKIQKKQKFRQFLRANLQPNIDVMQQNYRQPH